MYSSSPASNSDTTGMQNEQVRQFDATNSDDKKSHHNGSYSNHCLASVYASGFDNKLKRYGNENTTKLSYVTLW